MEATAALTEARQTVMALRAQFNANPTGAKARKIAEELEFWTGRAAMLASHP